MSQIEVKRISVANRTPQPEAAESEASVHHETAASEHTTTEQLSATKPHDSPLFQVKTKKPVKAVDGSAVLGREAMKHYAENYTVSAQKKPKKQARYTAVPNSRLSTSRPASKTAMQRFRS